MKICRRGAKSGKIVGGYESGRKGQFEGKMVRGSSKDVGGGSSKQVEGKNIGKMVRDHRSYTDSEFLSKVPS